MSALVGAITWNLITWYFGIPSSSSHALIGGLIGAGLASGVTVDWDKVVEKVAIPMVVSPALGFTGAFLVMLAIMWIFRRARPHAVNRGFRLSQTVSAAMLSLGHGLQDAQKTMGVIVLALIAGGHGPAQVSARSRSGSSSRRRPRSRSARSPAACASCARWGAASSRSTRLVGSPPS